MGLNLEKIFLPSVGVDLVFNMDTITPVAKPSIIYDTDYEDKTIIIAQPVVPVTRETEFKQLHLTTIVHTRQRKTRVGLSCRPVQFIDNYPLANRAVTRALKLKYSLPVIETNIRAAFRLPLSQRHTVKAKLLYEKREYYTARDFKIKDISFAGLGLVVHKTKGNFANPLLGLKKGARLPLGLSLVDNTLERPVLGTFPVKVQVARFNPNYSETHVLVGLKIIGITPENETLLIKFIHEAQIDELKRISKKG